MAASWGDTHVAWGEGDVTWSGVPYIPTVAPSGTGTEDYISGLQRLADSTASSDEATLWNTWAGTSGLDSVTAVNIACGTTGLDFPAALSTLAFGVPGHDVPESIQAIAQ